MTSRYFTIQRFSHSNDMTSRLSSWTKNGMFTVTSSMNGVLHKVYKGRSPSNDTVGKQTHDLTVIANDSKTTQSGGDNRKIFPLGAALQVPQKFSFASL